MKGEFSRLSFDPRKHYAGVLQQQGRVGLDSDWNEWVEIVLGKIGRLTRDVIGAGGRPQQATGFEISVDSTVSPPDLLISDGRLYAAGLQAESESPGHKGTHFSAQTDWPLPAEAAWNALFTQGPAWPGLDFSSIAPGGSMTQLIYAEVWLRHVTALNDEAARDEAFADAAGNPDWTSRPEVGDYIRERALGGPDTSTRLQTVAQVKHWDNLDANIQTCDQACAALASALPPKTIGTMLLDVTPTPPVTDPCQEPLQGGYGGAWNQAYRVEIHDPGAAGTATFKWSIENGAFTVRIKGPALSGAAAATDIIVMSIGNDQETQLSANDWVEVCGEETELGVFRNALAQVKATPVANTDGTWTIQLTGAVVIPHAPFLRRWSAGTQTIVLNQQFNLDAGSGLAVRFFDASGGAAGPTNFHSQDYWNWSARVDIRAVEPEALSHVAQPRRGVERHYCCLAILTWQNQNGSIANTANAQCTPIFPPLTGITGEGCDCTVCVSAASHNNNTLTIQSAINQIEGSGGGKVCLGPGIYNITSTITVSGNAAIDISGHGLPSLVAAASESLQPILVIDGTMNIAVEGIAFVGPPDDPDQSPIPGVVISNSSFVTIQRCAFTSSPPSAAPAAAVALAATVKPAAIGGPGPGGTLSPAIGVSGFAQNTQIHDNYFSNVQVGIGPSPISQALTPFLSSVSIRNNTMDCTVAGLSFADQANVALFTVVSFACNLVSSPSGFVFRGSGFYVSVERNVFNTSGEEAIACSASQSRISDNTIEPGASNSGDNGIVLDSSTGIQDVQVTGNLISGLLGYGIVVTTVTVLTRVAISRNQLSDLGGAGILSFSGSFATDLDVTGNVMTSVGQDRTVALTTTSTTGILGGILLLANSSSNVRVCENVIESVGPGSSVSPPAGTWVGGIFVTVGQDLRVAGNRILDIGPIGPVSAGFGILILGAFGRLDIVDNEVRRASTPPLNGDPSTWGALTILVAGDANIRGNALEAFGQGPIIAVGQARSCLFSNNECFLDNPAGAVLSTGEPLNTIAVQLGTPPVTGVTLISPAIIASGNFVQSLIAGKEAVMDLNPSNPAMALTVLGNITAGSITVGGVDGAPLSEPWSSLNVMNG